MTLDQKEEEEETRSSSHWDFGSDGFTHWMSSVNQSSKHNEKTRYIDIIHINHLAGDHARRTEFETPRTDGI